MEDKSIKEQIEDQVTQEIQNINKIIITKENIEITSTHGSPESLKTLALDILKNPDVKQLMRLGNGGKPNYLG